MTNYLKAMHNSTKRNVLKLLCKISRYTAVVMLLLLCLPQKPEAKETGISKNNITYADRVLKATAVLEEGAPLEGKVVDEKGLPLIGVTIQLKESGNSKLKTTVSDIDGAFNFKSLETGKSYELTFTYLGFDKQVIKDVSVNTRSGDVLQVK